MSKDRVGRYDTSKASGGMYLNDAPNWPVVSLLLLNALVETLHRPKSPICSARKQENETNMQDNLNVGQIMGWKCSTLALRSSFSRTLPGFRSWCMRSLEWRKFMPRATWWAKRKTSGHGGGPAMCCNRDCTDPPPMNSMTIPFCAAGAEIVLPKGGQPW